MTTRKDERGRGLELWTGENLKIAHNLLAHILWRAFFQTRLLDSALSPPPVPPLLASASVVRQESTIHSSNKNHKHKSRT